MLIGRQRLKNLHLFYYSLSLLFHWLIKLNSIFSPNVYDESMIKIVPSDYILVHVYFKVPFMSHARNLKKKTWSLFQNFIQDNIPPFSITIEHKCRRDLCFRLKLDSSTSEEMYWGRRTPGRPSANMNFNSELHIN